MLFFTLSLIAITDRWRGKYLWSLLFFLLAAVGAYSRIYLSQHFALDVFAGMTVAILCTLLMYFVYVPKTINSRFWTWDLRKLKK